MSWTNPASHIFATSEVVTASTMNTYIQANLTFLGVGYGAQMSQLTAQSIPTSVETLIHFDTIINDPNGMCTTGVGALITIPANAGGVYIVTWRAGVVSAAPTFVAVWLRKNGVDVALTGLSSPNSSLTPNGATLLLLSPADTLQVMIEHNAGVASNTVVTTDRPCLLACHLISPN